MNTIFAVSRKVLKVFMSCCRSSSVNVTQPIPVVTNQLLLICDESPGNKEMPSINDSCEDALVVAPENKSMSQSMSVSVESNSDRWVYTLCPETATPLERRFVTRKELKSMKEDIIYEIWKIAEFQESIGKQIQEAEIRNEIRKVEMSLIAEFQESLSQLVQLSIGKQIQEAFSQQADEIASLRSQVSLLQTSSSIPSQTTIPDVELDGLDDSIKITSSIPEVGVDACDETNSLSSGTSITVDYMQDVTVLRDNKKVAKVNLYS